MGDFCCFDLDPSSISLQFFLSRHPDRSSNPGPPRWFHHEVVSLPLLKFPQITRLPKESLAIPLSHFLQNHSFFKPLSRAIWSLSLSLFMRRLFLNLNHRRLSSSISSFQILSISYSRWLTGNMTYLMISSLTKPPLTTPPSKVFYISFFPSIIYNFPLCIHRWLEALPDLNDWCCHLLIQRCFLAQRFNCRLLQLLFHNGGRFLSSLNLMESYCRFLIDFKSLCLCVCVRSSIY